MNKRKQRSKKARRYLKTWFIASQALGIVGALTIGSYLDSGAQGYLMGYGIGVILSLGGTIGFS